MKIGIFVLLVSAVVTAGLGAQAANKTFPQFTAEAGTFVTGGTADEIVYADQSSQSKLSELLWPVPVSPGLKASVGAQWNPWLKTSLWFQTVIPLTTGNMSDDDWNVNGDLYDSDGNLCSTFHSDSTAYLTSDWTMGLDFAVPFRAPGFDWRLGAGVEYTQMSWEAWNTKQTNTLASDGSTYTYSMTGLSGTYRQSWIFAYLAAGLSVGYAGALWDFDLKVAPFPYVSATDAHILRQLTFNETLTGGFMVEPSVSATFPVSSALSVKVTADYQGSFFQRGDETLSYDGVSSSSSYTGFWSFAKGAGAGWQGFTLGLGLVAAL